MKTPFLIVALITAFFNTNCNSDQLEEKSSIHNENPSTTALKSIKYLALGDSYTIGQNLCESCRFPEQLKTALQKSDLESSISLRVIAATGWTTSNLLNGIESEKIENNYDLVTLLIGVNNQYQGREFSLYEKEFPILVQKSIILAKGNKNKVIVISIPDYAFTPFGKAIGKQSKITSEIDRYNLFAADYCKENNIEFVNITDITRNGLKQLELVATDGLHPSKEAYQLFVDRIAPLAVKAIK